MEIVTVAMDAQGSDRPRQYTTAAGATFPTLIDVEGTLSAAYGFRVVPNGWVIDPEGVIRFQQIGGFDIRKPETKAAVEQVLEAIPWSGAGTSASVPVAILEGFQKGVRLLREGRTRDAIETWLLAAEADPGNLLIRKQIWHVLHPEHFEPDIDLAWQRDQMELEKRIGIRAANRIPDDLS